MAYDPRGRLYVAGESDDSTSSFHFITLKYDADGLLLWSRTYHGPADTADYTEDVAVDPQGNVYVTGSSWGIGTMEDFATISYDSAGNLKWTARYDGPNHTQDFPEAIAVDSQSNVYVAGWCNAPTNADYATIKYDSLGNETWVRLYNGPGNGRDILFALAVDSSGNAYVTGRSAGSGTGFDIATIKYNRNGDTLWVRRYTGPPGSVGNDLGRSIAVDPSGNVYVTGYSDGLGTGADYVTIKYNSNGDTAWVRRYDGPPHRQDWAYALTLDPAGNVYVTGKSQPSDTDLADFLTVKYDNMGNQRWTARYNGPVNSSDVPKCVAVDGQGNVYVAGGSIGPTPNGDYCTIKYDSLGNQLWVTRYDGPANNYDDIAGLAVDVSGNVYVTGTSDMNVAPVMCTIKYRQFVGVEELTPSGVPLRSKLFQNVPNPWTSGTRISYSLPLETQVVLRVYNPVGQLVRTLVSGKESAGFKQVAWDGRDDRGRRVPSGVYFYRLQAGGYSDTRKMVLIR